MKGRARQNGGCRIVGAGRIDRNRPLSFHFDGRLYRGFAGDTLASALLANGVRVVGRSFKYHRPRGVFSAGSDEPNALMEIGEGAAAIPNQRATIQELRPGLSARSQNRWPRLGFDLLAANDFASGFLGAGFYYKTFMWPPRFWERLYEPLIRRAAGLGRLGTLPDDRPREKAHAFCDLLVIGGGPAGLVAALAGARAGADVILADEDFEFGGRLLAESEEIAGRPAMEWVDGVLRELAAHPNVRLMPRTTVTGVYDGGLYGALERLPPATPEPPGGARRPVECFWRIRARRAVLASGALERTIAFPGNDRPGVMLCSAVRAYVNRWGVAPGRRTAIFGNSDDIYRTARDLEAAGMTVVAIIDSRDAAEGDGLRDRVAAAGARGWRVMRGAVVEGTTGRGGLRRVHVFRRGRRETVAADCLAVSGGWNPVIHLSCHHGGRPVWNPAIAGFVPPAAGSPGAVPGLHPAGAALGSYSTRGAMKSGYFRARLALGELDFQVPVLPLPRAGGGGSVGDGATASPLWAVEARGHAWIDLQNDVTTSDIRRAAQEAMTAVEHMKRYTTQGMGTDQGKGSSVLALAYLAHVTGRDIPETGITSFRPPYTPVPIAALGAGGQGEGFAPHRHLPSAADCARRGAAMVEAGLWHRPAYFPAEGEETWRQTCDREVAMVRGAVGVSDATSLGKIALRGSGAAAFADYVYANRMADLRPGRVRYGLMLREDGHVMDDGTLARLDEEEFLLTTTTAAADEVLRHLEFAAQARRPDLDLRICDETEQWAQFALAGPRVRDLLGRLLTGVEDLPDLLSMPFMTLRRFELRDGSGARFPARLFRISFSGELGYELAVPAGYGPALWSQLSAAASELGGGPYGLEALNVLRIEKGFLTHAEIDGRTTAGDLGFGRLLRREGDFIGRVMAERPGLAEEAGREQLVGLRPLGAVRQLTAGAFLFEPGARPVAANAQGHVTSACYSPTLESSLALALLRDGRARLGETLRMVDHLRRLDTLCQVEAPAFFDPEGVRARG